MREFAVTDDMPQKNCATMTITMSSRAMLLPADEMNVTAQLGYSTASSA